jgi:hypothetical protein
MVFKSKKMYLILGFFERLKKNRAPSIFSGMICLTEKSGETQHLEIISIE